MQFNRIRQPKGARLGRTPQATDKQIRGVPSAGTHQGIQDSVDSLVLPTMALGPQKVNSRPHSLVDAEHGTGG